MGFFIWGDSTARRASTKAAAVLVSLHIEMRELRDGAQSHATLRVPTPRILHKKKLRRP